MQSNYTSSNVPLSVQCEKCKSTRTHVTDKTTYGHYYRCESCKHTWYAQASAFRFSD
jgi:ssDNA-binding Zn-finger/Zn-ribbon topoisomerase 1